MKKLLLILLFALSACASPAKKEFQRYAAENQPKAGKTMKWSEFYEGLYSRASAAEARGDELATLNDSILTSQQFERGEIDKDTFNYRMRSIWAGAKQNEEQHRVQAQAASNNAMIAAAQVMQANQPRTFGTPAPVAAAPPNMLVGFLKGQSVNGALKYCTYTNGVVTTIGVVDLCPMQTQ